MGVTAMLEYIAQFGLRTVWHTAIAVEQIQVGQVAADGGQHDEQTSAYITWQSRITRPSGRVRLRALRHRLAGNHADQRVSEIVHEI